MSIESSGFPQEIKIKRDFSSRDLLASKIFEALPNSISKTLSKWHSRNQNTDKRFSPNSIDSNFNFQIDAHLNDICSLEIIVFAGKDPRSFYRSILFKTNKEKVEILQEEEMGRFTGKSVRITKFPLPTPRDLK